jgi:glycosyltransferase involved in cell wall biosynthesis
VYLAGESTHPEGGVAQLASCRALGRLGKDEMNVWLARASVYASPALYEPFGLGVLEAAIHGCALVLSDIPTFRELWDDAAAFVPPRDSGLLAAAIDAFTIRPEMREEYGHRARGRAVRYSSSRMAEDYLAVYDQAASTYARVRGARVRCAS